MTRSTATATAQNLIPAVYPGSTIRIRANAFTAQPVGDDHDLAGVWEVTRVNSTTFTIRQPATGKAGRIGHAFAVPVDEPLAEAPAAPEPTFPRHVPCGALVRLNAAGVKATKGKYTADQLFVVLADKIERVNIVPVGGDDDRYYRMARAGLAEVVDPATVLR